MASGNKVKKIKPLNEEAAVHQGAEFLGLFMIYLVSLSTIAYEIQRNNRNAKEKRKSEFDYRNEIESNIADIKTTVQLLEQQIKNINTSKVNPINDHLYWIGKIVAFTEASVKPCKK